MKRFVWFSIGSVIGAAIDFAIGLALIQAGLPAWAALALAMSVSASVVYVIHQKITFADLQSRDLHAGRLTAFLTSTVLVYLFRLVLFESLTRFGLSATIALAVALVASVAVNFTVSRMLIFSRIGRKG